MEGQKAYRHFTDEEIKRANSVSLIDLARQYGFELENGGNKALHAKKSGGLYIFKDSNRFYHWTADEKGGPIDLLKNIFVELSSTDINGIMGNFHVILKFIRIKAVNNVFCC